MSRQLILHKTLQTDNRALSGMDELALALRMDVCALTSALCGCYVIGVAISASAGTIVFGFVQFAGTDRFREDIDEILGRSSKVVTHTSATDAGSSFAQAHFGLSGTAERPCPTKRATRPCR